jgi:hypothetical protein
MTNNFRGYGGNASETDNYDWWSPVITEPKYNTLDEYTGTYTFPDGSIFNELNVTTNGNVLTITSAMGSTNLQNQGGDNFYLNEYGAPVIFRRGSNGVVDSVYIKVQGIELFGKKDGYDYVAPILDLYSPPNPSGGGYGYGGNYGGDSMGGLNDALSAQIAEEIRRSIEAQIQAQIEADMKLQEAAEYFRIAENQRKLAEAMEAERLRILADENERRNISALEAERWRKANEELAAEAERQRLAEIEAEKNKQAALNAATAAKAKADADAKVEADRVAKEKAILAEKAEASAKAIASAEVAALEAENKRLAAIEAQKVADALKVKTDVISETVKGSQSMVLQGGLAASHEFFQSLNKKKETPKTEQKSSNNTLVIGGILLAVVVLYVITKDKN